MSNKVEATDMKQDSKRELKPKLRFPEFQDAPEWEEMLLAKAANVIAGQSPKGSNYNDKGVGTPFYQGITDFGDVYINKPTKWTTQITKLAKQGDILMSVRAPVGALNISTDKICIGRGLASIQAKQNKWYLYYFLNRIQRFIVGNGGSIFDSISKSQIEEINVLIPDSVQEQRKIADCLTSLDELVDVESQKLEALQSHRKGLLQQLFPAEGETLPQLRFPEFRNAPEWEIWQLGDLLLSHPDYGVNAPAVPFTEDLPAYLRITDISEEGYYLSDGKVSVNIKVADENYLSEGDIVLARTGASVGKSYKYRKDDGKLVFAGYLIRIKPDQKRINSTFLFNFLSTDQYWKWVSVMSVRGGQPGINATQYASLSIPIPPTNNKKGLSEQQKIADCLSSLDELIAAQSQKLNTLEEHKIGLMQQLFPSLMR